MQRRTVIACVIGFLCAAVLAGAVVSWQMLEGNGPSGPRDDPAAFMSRIVTLIVADDYSTAWQSLNRAHKRVAPQREYVACERLSPVDSRLTSIRVVRVADRSFRVPGATESVSAKAVTLRIALRNGFGANEKFDHTFNVVADGAAWTWVLTPNRYALYRDDACGAT